MQQNVRTNRRHERLEQIGLTERIVRSRYAKPVWVTHHVCKICDTLWRHVDDPGNPHVGWSIEKELHLHE
jgi:hypothetical protein